MSLFPSRWPQGNKQTRKHDQMQDMNNTHDPQKKYLLGTVSKNILMEGLNRFYGAKFTLSSDVDQDT